MNIKYQEMGYYNSDIKIKKSLQDNILEQRREIADLMDNKRLPENSVKLNFLLLENKIIKVKRKIADLKKKPKKIKIFYILYIKSSLRGFHINISSSYGKVLKVFTLGKLGFKKAQRYNRFSLILLVNKIFGELKILKKSAKNNDFDFKLHIFLKNFNSKREQLVRRFFRKFLKKRIASVVDLGDFPYNGCRPKSAKRK